jgi:hypothetical protein
VDRAFPVPAGLPPEVSDGYRDHAERRASNPSSPRRLNDVCRTDRDHRLVHGCVVEAKQN